MERSTCHRRSQCLRTHLGILRNQGARQGDREPALPSLLLYRRSVQHPRVPWSGAVQPLRIHGEPHASKSKGRVVPPDLPEPHDLLPTPQCHRSANERRGAKALPSPFLLSGVRLRLHK